MIDIATEKALLGSVLLENGHYHEIAERAVPEDFSSESNRRIFRRMGEILASGRSIDTLSLPSELARHGELESIGGYSYLSGLTDGVPRKYAVTEWTETLSRNSRENNTRRVIGDLQVRVDDPSTNVDELIGYAASKFIDLQPQPATAQGKSLIVPLLDQMERERTRTGELLGLPTGIGPLDRITRGVPLGGVMVYGAQSGVGKTAAEVSTAAVNCLAGNPTMIFSLEMTPEDLYRRLFSSISGVPFVRVRDPRWATDREMSKIRAAAERVAEWPLEIDASSSLHIDQLVARARHAIRTKGTKLVCVDYAQIVAADGRDERLRIAAVSRGVTRLAKEEGVAVLLLSQLARPDKSTNPNRRPRMSDLRETSQLENDASVVVLLHRPVDEDGNRDDQAELIVAKHRNGATGLCPMTFEQTTLSFVERKTPASTAAGKARAS